MQWFIRHCCGSHHQLMDGPCAGMRAGEKTTTFKVSTAQLLLAPCKAQHGAAREALGSYSEAKGICGPSGQPGVLCIILQGCAAGKALTVEAADSLDVN